MKSPELRKELSELILHKRGIRLNLQQPVIESEDEVTLRDTDALNQRLRALLLIDRCQRQQLSGEQLAALLQDESLLACLSDAELTALRAHHTTPLPDWQEARETLRFFCWAAGWLADPGMPEPRRRSDGFDALCLQLQAAPDRLPDLRLRSRSALLDWADLLFRLHWAVRHAQLMDKPVPGRLDAVAVAAWHKAVNWLLCYDDEADWDQVSTDTAG